MWFTNAAGWPESKHSFQVQAEREGGRQRETGWGLMAKKFKACEVTLEGHSLSAFSLPA